MKTVGNQIVIEYNKNPRRSTKRYIYGMVYIVRSFHRLLHSSDLPPQVTRNNNAQTKPPWMMPLRNFKLMQISHQKDLQTKFFHPFDRCGIPPLLDGFNQRTFAGVHRTLHSLGTLSTDGHVLSNVKECTGF